MVRSGQAVCRRWEYEPQEGRHWSWTRWSPRCTEGCSAGSCSGSRGAGVGASEELMNVSPERMPLGSCVLHLHRHGPSPRSPHGHTHLGPKAHPCTLPTPVHT